MNFVATASSLQLTLSRVKKTQIRMMMDRGYVIPQKELELLQMNDEAVWKSLEGYANIDSEYVKLEDENYVAGVYYRFKTNTYVDFDSIGTILRRMNTGIKEVILILDAQLSPRSKTTLQQMTACKSQIWMSKELVVNPTLHVHTPSVTLLSEVEENEIVKGLVKCKGNIPTKVERSLGRAKLPKMQSTDIITKWYRYPVGSIVQLDCNYAVCKGVQKSLINYRVVT